MAKKEEGNNVENACTRKEGIKIVNKYKEKSVYEGKRRCMKQRRDYMKSCTKIIEGRYKDVERWREIIG